MTNVNLGFWEYDVDLSKIGENCEAMFYLVAMPARNADGKIVQ